MMIAAPGTLEREVPAMTSVVNEKTVYFGDGGRLFGCHHDVSGATTACLLVPPFGHEAVRSHRAFRQLASRLAGEGRHVLRFDFTGCGDSLGDPNAASLATWSEDIRTAREEAAHASGADRVVVIGLGLGATLALISPGEAAAAMVAWDPVVRGGAWLDGVRTIHDHTLGHLDTGDDELLGFPLPGPLASAIRDLDLADLDATAAERLLVIDSAREPITDPLTQRMRELGAVVDVEHRPTPVLLGDDPFKPRVPGAILQAIAKWEGLS